MTSTPSSPCISEVLIRTLRGRWAPSLMKIVGDEGPIHFSAINRRLDGISAKVLTEQLRFLVGAGVFNRISEPDVSEVYYELSQRGRELMLALDSLEDLAKRWPEL